MNLPQDINILVSMLNMKLRDGDYSSLEDLCADMDFDIASITERLTAAGFEYNPTTNRIW